MTTDFNSHAPVAETPRRARVFCAFATALLLWLPAQKWGWFPLAWCALAPFLWATSGLASRTRFRYGWRAGWLFYALSNWWIVPTVIYGAPMIGAPAALGALLGVVAVGFIAGVHGLQFALVAWLWDEKRWADKLWVLPLLVGAVWAAFDWLRCVGPLSHIWGALAFTQWRDTALLQIAPFVGQHGLTALLVWCAANLALWRRARRRVFLAMPALVFAALHLYGARHLSVHLPAVKNAPFRALLVSTDVPSLRKTGLAPGETPGQQAWKLTEQVGEQTGRGGAHDLIVWPETTIEVLEAGGRFQDISQSGGSLKAFRQKYRAVLAGARHHRVSGAGEELLNSALLIDEKSVQSAPKIRTVPMGEKAPFGEWIPFLKRFAPTPEVTPGREAKLLNLPNGVSIGSVICFESCFPNPARSLAQKGAKMLFIITNDEWFAGTNAPWEHAAMAVVRAAENHVAVAQVANGGYTLHIDSHGRILHQSFGAGATPVDMYF